MESDFDALFEQLFTFQVRIKQELIKYADGKHLKGYELVGWLGEIYVKLLFDGKLVGDSHEHDVETKDGLRISVKTRKGRATGWKQSSAIPKFEGEGCPTHLAFVHLNDNYSLDRVWFYEWRHLCDNLRFTPKIVRGEFRSYIFKLDEKKDEEFVIYRNPVAARRRPPR